MKINCQANHTDDGCSRCGGFGVILEKITLECGHKTWVRPGVMTSFVGKKWETADGLACVMTVDGWFCVKCHNNLHKKRETKCA